jgi:hypothetical protein
LQDICFERQLAALELAAKHIAKRPRRIYKPRIVARTGEDLHDFDVFADRDLASDDHAGRASGPLRAASVSIDRA